jgi:hypothetical protein
MEALRETLRQRGLALKPRYKGYFAEAELFAEMERIWTTLGHRPSRIEWEQQSHASAIKHTNATLGGGSRPV